MFTPVGTIECNTPLTRFINSTGSREVGLRISQWAAKVQPGQKGIKRVAAERGKAKMSASPMGKQIWSWPWTRQRSPHPVFQGQKCSACSRLIVDQAVYDDVLERLEERTKRITVEPVKFYENWMGPISSAA